MFLIVVLFCNLMKEHFVYIIIFNGNEVSSYTIVSEFLFPHL